MAEIPKPQSGDGNSAEVSIGDVPSGVRWPVALMSVLWLGWIVFLIVMLVQRIPAGTG